MSMRRLPPRTGEVIDRAEVRRFTWNGEPVTGYGGDTIASALAASGFMVFSRSFKYRRSRGILTADQHDPNLLVQVGGEPNVRAGGRLLEVGMEVAGQSGWPSLRYDVRSATGLAGRFLGPGFYYKTFMGPRPLQSVYQRVLRRFGAGGTVGEAAPLHPEKRFAHPDVLVAGGGPAGMAVALGAARGGARVLLVDDGPELGGHLRWGGDESRARLEELRAELSAAGGIDVMTDAVVAGRYDHNWVAVVQRSGADERLVKARVKCLVVAAGTIERPYVFAGNDLPGVMLSGAALRLLNLWSVAPGNRAVVVTANASGDLAAGQLEAAGVDVAEVVDLRDPGDRLVRARGRGSLGEVELSGGRVLEADLLVTATGWTTATSLLNMAGNRPEYVPRAARFLPTALPDDVMAAGGIVGDGTLDEIVAHGSAVGAEAGRRAGRRAHEWAAATPRAAEPSPPPRSEPLEIPPLEAADHPETFLGPTDGFVDFSEDVRRKDLEQAAAEGYDSIELSKRYTTATMGPIQGKLEVVNVVAAHAAATGATISETGTTTWRPPYSPVTLGALAGRDDAPKRRSPMHDWHEAHRARPLVAGQWIRPDHYGDPAAEVRNTRRNVGIIDVSPLGKIDLRGADVPRLLEFVYTNRWSKLDVGRVRYGAMCGEDGVVFDDGVTARLGEDRYYMTTTSSGASGVWNWLDEWLQTFFSSWDVRMTAVTDGYAAMNVAGPGSRRALERVVEGVDLSRDAFGYMQGREATVAGVSGCILLRIGFTGELSFEVHAPAGYGLHVWESLLEAGSELGAAPFGVEAQRIMRLEKGHLIVGQDTDGLTKAHAAGLGWAVKAEKADFAGKHELVREAEAGPGRHIVAVQPADPQLVPLEASQIVAEGEIVGRITSSRMSPTLGRSVCLAQVDADAAAPGAVLQIELGDGRRAAARVMEHHAHFDPEGERLRG